MTGRQKLITGIAAAHILLVAYHSALLPLPPYGNPVGDALRWYGAVSGANNSYGFFKQVGCSIKVTFTILDKDGKIIEDKVHQNENREVQLRFNSASNLLDQYHTNALLHNWAAAMFGRHPNATLIRIKIETFDPGTMADYAAGVRPTWVNRTSETIEAYTRQQIMGN